MKKPIYFDYAATTPVHPEVVKAMLPYFSDDFGNAGSSQHYYGWMADEAVELARKDISTYFGVKPNQMVFTSGATESNNLAIQGYLKHHQPGHLITSVLEHKAVLQVFQALELQGWSVSYLQPDHKGLISPEALVHAIQVDTVLVSLMLVNNETGNLLDWAPISQICRERGICFHTDATQALGKVSLSDGLLLPDLISFSGHKIYGPKGIGGLIINSGMSLEPLVYGGGQERGIRSGTLPVQQIVGLASCFKHLPELMVSISRIHEYRNRIISQLNGNFVINTNVDSSLPHILNISIPHMDWEDLYRKIPEIAVSNGSACNAKSQLPSHVMKALGHTDDLALATLRISLSYLTKEEDVNFLIEYLNKQLFSE